MPGDVRLVQPQGVEDRYDVRSLPWDVGGLARQPVTAVTAPAVVDHLVTVLLDQLVHEGLERVAGHRAVDEDHRSTFARDPHVELVLVGHLDLVVGSGMPLDVGVPADSWLAAIALAACASCAVSGAMVPPRCRRPVRRVYTGR